MNAGASPSALSLIAAQMRLVDAALPPPCFFVRRLKEIIDFDRRRLHIDHR